jgi:hypothetical protein
MLQLTHTSKTLTNLSKATNDQHIKVIMECSLGCGCPTPQVIMERTHILKWMWNIPKATDQPRLRAIVEHTLGRFLQEISEVSE